MDYRIEKREAFKAVCRKKQVTKPQGDTATEDISALWNVCRTDGTIQKICKYGKFDKYNGILGICFSCELEKDGFPYAIGAEYNGAPVEDKNLEIVEIPANTYAVFQCRGRMPDAFRNTYNKICTEFFTQSNYEYGSGIELEVYLSDKVSDPDFYCEIWIAVKEKK